jgi:hypothetical protein
LEQWAAVHNKKYGSVVLAARSYARSGLGIQEGEKWFFDEPTLSVYGKTKPEMHKKLWIHVEGEEQPVEITDVSGVIRGQSAVRKIGRMFFLEKSHRNNTKQHLASQLATLPDVRRRS